MQMCGSQWGGLAAARSLYKAVFFTTSHARIRIRYYKSCENPYQYYELHVLHLDVQ